MAIRIGLLMLLQLGATPGKLFLVYTDNSTTFGAGHQRKSRDQSVNEEWKRIQDLLLSNKIDIVAKQVKSGENKADGLSRGDKGKHAEKDRLVLALPPDLQQIFVQE